MDMIISKNCSLCLASYLLLLFCVGSFAQQPCINLLMPDVCQAYVRWTRCNSYQARLSCRRTCGVCLPGWSTWTLYGSCSMSCLGKQVRTRTCGSLPGDCPGSNTQERPCNTICSIVVSSNSGGATVTSIITASTTSSANFVGISMPPLLPSGISRGARAGPGGKDISSILCNSTHFLCEESASSSRTCIDLNLVCDGFDDCPSSSDEDSSNCFASANTKNAFQIKNEFKQVCLEVITDDPLGPINGVRAYKQCPTEFNPLWSKFAWRWWRTFHLLNVYTGRCLEAQSFNLALTPQVTSRICDHANLNQQFICEDLLKLRLKYEQPGSDNFYLSLGDSNTGWPAVLQTNSSNYNQLWQLGSNEMPESLCLTQVYLSDWSSWSACSSTCKGGQRSRNRTCVNGNNGVAPCLGSLAEIAPCNDAISCTGGGFNQISNSRCFNGLTTLNNPYGGISSIALDPACYFVNPNPLPYNLAKEHCQNQNGFLAMVKDNSAQTLLSIFVSSINTSARAYIGIEENMFLPPVQGHHLRFDFDESPVGSVMPWFIDCVLGPGYDYAGDMDITMLGLQCQRWDSNFPHRVVYKPVGDINHNHCRNPNFDPKGPWCYTVSENTERDYCIIPQCMETSVATPISEDAEFLLALSCDNVIADASSYAIVFSLSDQLLLKACAPVQNRNWADIPASEKFVWDSSRSRIINLANMYCLEASSTDMPNFDAVLRPCDPRRVTQIWTVINNRITLTNTVSFVDFQLDASPTGRTVMVNVREQNAWTASRTGFFDDLALMQDAGFSFHIYSITDGMCLGTKEDASYPGQLVATDLKDERALGLFPCQQLPALRWIRYLSTFQTFFNLYSGLCLTPTDLTDGAPVILRRCDGINARVQWSCNDNMQLFYTNNANQLFLTVINGNLVLQSLSESTTRWAVGERNNQPICNSPVPEGNTPTGGSFALRNGFRPELCIQADEFGGLFTLPCADFGLTSSSSLVWSFTDSPTMLIQFIIRRCLSAISARAGSSVMASTCNVHDSRQQWLLSRQPISSQHPDSNTPFYNIHLAVNKNLVLSIDPFSGRVLLRTVNAQNFVAFNRFSHLSTVNSMSDCYVSRGSDKLYSGSVSTTRTGRRCVSWLESEVNQFPELVMNHCRNPGNRTRNPWCYTLSSSGVREAEDCLVPQCVSRKIVVDSSGRWHPVDGDEPLQSICQAEPECYRGNGVDYMGRFNQTSSGACSPWTSTSISSPILQENYCRNPTGLQSGPYCFVGSTQVTCSMLPRCQPVCEGVSPKLANAMVARLEYSGSGYGVETGTTVIIQCLPGFWINRATNRLEAQCILGRWSPTSAGCTRMECPISPPTAPLTELTAMGRYFGDVTGLTCRSGLLAGPMQPVLKYVCNILGEWERLGDPNSECSSPCEAGMVGFRGGCYAISTAFSSFDEALQASRALGGTMADLNDAAAFEFYKDLVLNHANLGYGTDSLYWLGIQHSALLPQSTDPLWRDWRSVNALNNAEIQELRGVRFLPFIMNSFRIRHFLHGRFISDPLNVIPYNSRCMFVDGKQSFVGARSCFDHPEETMLWAWISPFHLYHIASRKCLTGFAVESYALSDLRLQATVTQCNVNNPLQYVGCRRYSDHASLKLLMHDNSFFVDTLQDSWDRIHMGGGAYSGNFSHWVINDSNFDVCHHSLTYKGKAYLLWEGATARGMSYSYSQAVDRCDRDGAVIASESAVIESLNNEDVSSCACAWVEGGISVSVSRIADPQCPISLPLGGVKHCPTSTVADVWCYKGTNLSLPFVPLAVALYLESPEKFGVIEKNTLDKFRYIVRKESRWRCPDPPPAARARLIESSLTSYSYLGTTAYQCDPGYWFEQDVFSKVIFCSADLQWQPRPGTFACLNLFCTAPDDIPFATKTVNNVGYLGTASYRCMEGMWFGDFRFTVEIQCRENGGWLPPLSSLFCNVITCDNPPRVEFATFQVASLEYQSTAMYVCDAGYWFRPGVFETSVTCGSQAMWVPSPQGLTCWEAVCPPLSDNSSNIWNPKDRKLLDLSCMRGYYLSGFDSSFGNFRVASNRIEFECMQNGIWMPDPSSFHCAEARCTRPPDVSSAQHSGHRSVSIYHHGSEISYFCSPGSAAQYMFAPYSKRYDMCLYQGVNNVIYASEESCSTSDMIFLQWGDSPSEDGFYQLIHPQTRFCLTAIFTPSIAGGVNGVRFQLCNAQSVRQYWFCNYYGVSELILGVGRSPIYLSIDQDTNIVYATDNKNDAVDFISYFHRSSDVDIDVCRFQRPRSEQHVACLADGSWLPDPNLILCVSIFCPPPPASPFSTIQMDTIDGGYGSYVTYTCQDGYAFVGGSVQFVVRCSENGNWVPNPLEFPCKRASCPRYIIPSGSVITVGDIDNNQFGSILMIACPLGYTFRDNVTSVTVRCQANGQWEESELLQDCLPISCGPPAGVIRSTVMGTGLFVYNTLARYVCNSGYRFDVGRTWSDVYCNAEGLWEPDPSSLQCSVVYCPRPLEVANSAVYVQGVTQNSLYAFGAVAFYQCQNGMQFYEGIIKRAVTCRDDGMWHPDPATLFCTEMTCPSVSDLIPRNAYAIGYNYAFGGEIEIHCEAGYLVEKADGEVEELVTSRCAAFNQWDPDPSNFLCVRRPCSPLPIVLFARPSSPNGVFGSQIQYTCSPGYYVRPGVGGYLTTCVSNGTWDPNPDSFRCEPINCGNPGVYEYALPVQLINSTTQFGMFATVECQDGFWFDNVFKKQATIQCTEQGLWEPPPEDFRCVFVRCSDPGEIQFATVSVLPPDVVENVTSVDPVTRGLFYDYGVRLNYSCGNTRAWSRAQRDLIVTCTSTGAWSIDISTITCSRIRCPSPYTLAFAFVTLNNAFTFDRYYVGSVLQYTCFEGYWFRRDVYSMRAICQNDGNWNITPTENCIRVSCPTPPSMMNGNFSILSYPLAGRYICDPGYHIPNNPVLICSLLGQWAPDPSTLNCQPLLCPRPPTIANAIAVSTSSTRLYQSRVTFRCLTNFRFRSGSTFSDIVCDGDGTWSGTDIACLPINKIECFFPPLSPNSYYVSRAARTIVLTCHPGYIISSSQGLTAGQVRFCNDDGTWTPPAATCQESLCPTPTLVNGSRITSPVALFPGQTFRIGDKINITCDRGSAFPFSPISRTFTSTVTFTCQLDTNWFPLISSFPCQAVFCPTPPRMPGSTVRYLRIDYGSVAVYRCSPPTTYQGSLFRLSTCTIDGQWQPDPNNFQCLLQRCRIPEPPPFTILSIGNYQLDPDSEFTLQRLQVACSTGYTIVETFQNSMSKVFVCDITGQWTPYDPAHVNCTAVFCPPPGGAVAPNFQVSSSSSQTSYPYGSSLTFSCSGGFWLSPGNLRFILSRCMRNGTWEPQPTHFQCLIVTCSYPPLLPFSTLRLYTPVSQISNGLEYGSVWRYSCIPGYSVDSGEAFGDIQCQDAGRWLPAFDQVRCKPAPCAIPPHLPNIINSYLSVIGDLDLSDYPDEFRSGNNYTYQCLDGYWMSNGSMKSKSTNVTCVQGTWIPSPRSIPKCVPVVCDEVILVTGARSDGIARVYGSQVFYTCPASQHFRRYKLRRVVSTCNGSGLWDPDPYTLFCSDVFCDDFDIPGTFKFGTSLRGGSSLIFSCPSGMRFTSDTTQLATTCDQDGIWDPDITTVRCEEIICGTPQVRNAMVQEPTYTTGTTIQLECLGGFNLVPQTPTPFLITCGRTGNWVPDLNNYKCQGRKCSRPDSISNGVYISSGEDSVGDFLRILCNPGYYIMPGKVDANLTCMPDATWSQDISLILCIAFTCPSLVNIPRTRVVQVSTISPPQYNSVVRYTCNLGTGFERNVLHMEVRCTEKGMWDPPINFRCRVLDCSSPPSKRNAVLEGNRIDSGIYPVSHNFTYRCSDFSWLSAQYAVAKWAFTGLLDVEVRCMGYGDWSPSPDSFACRPIHEGPLPTGYDRGLSSEQVEREMWLKEDNYLTQNLMNQPHVFAIKTGISRWVKGGDIPLSVAREGAPALSDGHFAWDGDLTTSWVPSFSPNRRYNITIYLGKQLQIVEAITIFSGESEFERVVHFVVRFSVDGRRFNESVSTAPSPRQLAEVETRLIDVSSRQSITGFSYPAKFIQVIVIHTSDLNFPPIIYEIRIFSADGLWSMRYPYDYLSIILFVGLWIVIFLFLFNYSRLHDIYDRFKIQFVPTSITANDLSRNYCYIVDIKINNIKHLKYFFCRVLYPGKTSAVFLVNSRFQTGRLRLFIPTFYFDPPVLQFAILDKQLKTPVALLTKIKIGVMKISDTLKETVAWLQVDEVLLYSGKAEFVVFGESSKRRLADVLSRRKKLEETYLWNISQMIYNHMVISVFTKHVVSQISRLDNLLLSDLGFLSAIACALLISSVLPIPCLVLVFFCSGFGLFIAFIFRFWLLSDRVYGLKRPPKSADDDEHPLFGLMETAQSYDKTTFKQLEKRHDGVRALTLLGELEDTEKRKVWKNKTASNKQISNLLDSFLLPESYRHPPPDLSKFEELSVTSLDFEFAFLKRTRSARRRTRSAPSILIPKRKPLFTPPAPRRPQPIKSASQSDKNTLHSQPPSRAVTPVKDQISLKTPSPSIIEPPPVIERFVSAQTTPLSIMSPRRRVSCASMWEEESLAEEWHRVHTSLNVEAMLKDKSPLNKKRIGRSGFLWMDPAYRRIPSEHLIRQSHFPKSIWPQSNKYKGSSSAPSSPIQERLAKQLFTSPSYTEPWSAFYDSSPQTASDYYQSSLRSKQEAFDEFEDAKNEIDKTSNTYLTNHDDVSTPRETNKDFSDYNPEHSEPDNLNLSDSPVYDQVDNPSVEVESATLPPLASDSLPADQDFSDYNPEHSEPDNLNLSDFPVYDQVDIPRIEVESATLPPLESDSLPPDQDQDFSNYMASSIPSLQQSSLTQLPSLRGASQSSIDPGSMKDYLDRENIDPSDLPVYGQNPKLDSSSMPQLTSSFQSLDQQDLNQNVPKLPYLDFKQTELSSFSSSSKDPFQALNINRIPNSKLLRVQDESDESDEDLDEDEDEDEKPVSNRQPGVSQGVPRVKGRRFPRDWSRDLFESERKRSTSSIASLDSYVPRKKRYLRRKDRTRSMSVPPSSRSTSSHLITEIDIVDSSTIDGVSSTGIEPTSEELSREASFLTLLDVTRSEETIKNELDQSDAEKSLSGVTSLVRERFVDELVTTDSNESRHVYCIAPSAGFTSSDFIDDCDYEDALEYHIKDDQKTDVTSIFIKDEIEKRHFYVNEKSDRDSPQIYARSSKTDYCCDLSELKTNISEEDDKMKDQNVIVHPSALTGEDEKNFPKIAELTHVVSTHPAAYFHEVPLLRRRKSQLMILIIILLVPVITYFGLRGIDQREYTVCLLGYTTLIFFIFLFAESWFRQTIWDYLEIKEEVSLPMLYPTPPLN